MTILAGFADISLWQLALVAGVALFASLHRRRLRATAPAR